MTRGTSVSVAPNPRVQRTRPYASLRGSPLTRHPLGGPERQVGRGNSLRGAVRGLGVGILSLVICIAPGCSRKEAASSTPVPAIAVRAEVAFRVLGVPKGPHAVVLRVPSALVTGIEPSTEVAAELKPGVPLSIVVRVVPVGQADPSSRWIPARMFGWTEDNQFAILVAEAGDNNARLLDGEQTRWDPQSAQLLDVEFRSAPSGRLEFLSFKSAGRSALPPITWK